ncbi:J domain-containing protein [Brevundimonas sp. BH3]|uniref:J domain-containing protein n=1 Tax=unclassified Brevundimonas TaxID=2622653 RepID=UPI00289DA674|nr:J domain-containing protein [Brevundimonas sp.]
MSASFEYKPRFTDIRVKPPKPEEEAAAADVLHLKPGEIPCEWADCSRPATAKAPKSREQINQFYNFCQAHAGQYNKNWNFYSGMSEGEIRAAQENEAMTGGRPTWDMKVSRNSRVNAGSAAKHGPADATAGSWQDSYGLFGRRVNESAPSGPVMSEAEARMGKLERQAIAELGLEPGADKAAVKARYHELLKRFHPDMNGGDRATEAKLQHVIKAYKTLKKAGYG